MADHYEAFEISPVPAPGPDVAPPEVFRGIYGMPMYVTVPTADLSASVEFWTRGLGFVDLFTMPGQVTHLRRWAFQDVLLVPAAGTVGIGLSCVMSQIDEIARACDALVPGSATGPRKMPWNALELNVTTPENARVTVTAALPLTADSAEERHLDENGFMLPKA
ncbi:VOC family protein [Actinomadura sp. ATCC 31491]|uniref:VOC family protein n=1 Tax=Actinomadura luzonensis TaxID=2805427 RepID=A0ABT0FS17_9ACTN|nr:VOC family protein [Actinomadura luzonensis]MCK2214785.1 VOC family protein [Actinomadura luzonensis]